MGEFSIRLHIHLFQQPRPVSADRFGAERQFGGNFLDFLAGSDQTQYLILTIRQVFMERLIILMAGIQHQLVGYRCADILPATQDFADRLNQFFRRALFVQIARCPGSE